jgi:hypothetical protein
MTFLPLQIQFPKHVFSSYTELRTVVEVFKHNDSVRNMLNYFLTKSSFQGNSGWFVRFGWHTRTLCWLWSYWVMDMWRMEYSVWHVSAAVLSAWDWRVAVQQMYGSNGAGTMTSCTVVKPLPPPGNWRHPAGLPLGYSAARVRLYCQAKWGAPAPTGEYSLRERYWNSVFVYPILNPWFHQGNNICWRVPDIML